MNKQVKMDLKARLNKNAAEAIIDLFERVEKLEKQLQPAEEKVEEKKEEVKVEEVVEEQAEEQEEIE